MKDNKVESAIRFYLLATQLKYRIRSGWDKTHWNISAERLESIAEHIYGTCVLALSIDSEFNANIDIDKVVKMLILHELGEIVIGDITPFDNIGPEEKKKKEHEAIGRVVGDLVKKDEYLSLLDEFNDKKTKEAVFAYHCDKIEADIQAKCYQDMGFQHSINNDKDIAILQNTQIQQSIKNGAKNFFDIWYEWDKEKFKDDENFMAILDYIKRNDTQNLINETFMS